MIEPRHDGRFGVYLLALLVSAASLVQLGCVAEEQQQVSEEPFQEPEQPPAYAITDTTEWECGGNGGRFGILRVNESYVDTVDISFGVQALADGYILLPMRTEDHPQVGPFTCPTEPVFFDGTTKVLLAELLPLFNASFSNPTATEAAVYYWGFHNSRLYAVRYQLADEAMDTTFLTDDPSLLATGNRYQFLPPELTDQQVVFPTWPGRTFFLNPNLELMADSVVQR